MEDWNGIARKAGFADEKAMLTSFYIEDQLPVSEIARRLNFGIATIAGRLTKCGIDKRARGGPNNQHKITRLLFRLDQRFVFSTPTKELGELLGVHESTVYKYKRGVQSVKGA